MNEERLESSIIKVRILVDFHKQFPNLRINEMDSMTTVTITDLKILLDGLEDRGISTAKMPELIPLKQVAMETEKAKVEIEKEREDIERQREWIKGYNQGYAAGRDGELKRIETLINNYIRGTKQDD